MKTKTLRFIVVALLCFSQMLSAQEKYAILISGDRPDREPSPPGYELYNLWWASWNDTYLMWEMLVYEKGYDNDNVFVLFADGYDWSLTLDHDIAERYDAQVSHYEDFPGQFDQFTDDAATLANVQNLFQDLANGTGGLPQITEDDFLFIWLYGRNTNPG
ncbi:MAG: hypothetical protein K8S16_13000 [Bacteroidales bacterium]|nr:hypothetical protein [Bacteroidales bacterium]